MRSDIQQKPDIKDWRRTPVKATPVNWRRIPNEREANQDKRRREMTTQVRLQEQLIEDLGNRGDKPLPRESPELTLKKQQEPKTNRRNRLTIEEIGPTQRRRKHIFSFSFEPENRELDPIKQGTKLPEMSLETRRLRQNAKTHYQRGVLDGGYARGLLEDGLIPPRIDILARIVKKEAHKLRQQDTKDLRQNPTP